MRGRVALLVLGAGLALSAHAHASTTGARVVELDLDGVVQPLSASYVVDGVRAAERAGSPVLLRVDTPGGLDSSTREIVSALLGAKVPVVCWVGPQGARAASAGTFVLLACHVATMAPGTNVGAAHPVGFSGRVLADKSTADAAAFMRSIAQARGRDAAWAESAVTSSASATAEEAVRLGVVDAVAATPDDALRAADGRSLEVAGRQQTLETWPADPVAGPRPVGTRLVDALVDPNVAFVLLVLGLALLAVEILHPGLIVPGVGGAAAILIALVMLQTLPVRLAAVGLLLLGVALFVAELHIPGFGLPFAAGLGSVALGGLFLFDADTLVQVSRWLLFVSALGLAALFFVVLRSVGRARRLPVAGDLTGEEGSAVTELSPLGTVRVRGENWSAESIDGILGAGSRVLVVEREGLTLKVTAF